MLRVNNARIRAVDRDRPNPRPIDNLLWHRGLARRCAALRSEWRAFVDAGGRLDGTSDVAVGALVVRGRAAPDVSDVFPRTMRALGSVPLLRSAVWVVLEPGADLAPRTDANAGTLRYELTVVGNTRCGLRVGGTAVRAREGGGVLFDDTVEHSAWNHGPWGWVVLRCEVLRPLPRASRWLNRAAQMVASPAPAGQPPRVMPAFCRTSAGTPSSRHDP